MTAGGSSWGWEDPSDRRFTVEFETGAIWQSRNEIHIPDNENGTRFDLRSLQGTSPDVHRRAELTWNVPPPPLASVCVCTNRLFRQRLLRDAGSLRWWDLRPGGAR